MYGPKEDVFSTVMSYLDANAMGFIFSGQNHVIHMDEPALLEIGTLTISRRKFVCGMNYGG